MRERVVGRTIGHCGTPRGCCTNRDSCADRIIAPAIPVATPVIIDVDVGVAIAGVDAVAAIVDATALTWTLTGTPGTAGSTDATNAADTADTADTADATGSTDAAGLTWPADTTNAAGASWAL